MMTFITAAIPAKCDLVVEEGIHMKLLDRPTNATVSLKNVLFATDFSAVSEAALPYVKALSLYCGSTIYVAHVITDSHPLSNPATPDASTLGAIYEEAPTRAAESMQKLTRSLKGFTHETHIRHGKPSEALSDIIREEKIDLLITATHGRTGVGKLVLGSVAEEILRQVPCPVLTIGPKVHSSPPLRRYGNESEQFPTKVNFDRILCATDFTPHSKAAASYAFSIAREFRSRLTLLHVIEQYGDDLNDRPGPIEKSLHELQDLTPTDAPLAYTLETVTEFGSPAECILEAAAERDAGLIVLSVQSGDGKLVTATHLPAATAHKIIVKAKCPVLTVRTRDSHAIEALANITLTYLWCPPLSGFPF